LIDELLAEEALVDRLPQGHEALDPGLELDEQIDVDRGTAQAHPPGDVSFAGAEPLGDEGGVGALQRGEVELLDPCLGNKAAEQVLDYPGMVEQKAIAAVMLGLEQMSHVL
jgi:hypothetical protein